MINSQQDDQVQVRLSKLNVAQRYVLANPHSMYVDVEDPDYDIFKLETGFEVIDW